MKCALVISFFCFSFFTLAMDAPREIKTQDAKIQNNIAAIKAQVEANGYAIFDGIDQSIFSDEELSRLAQVCKVGADFPEKNDKAHATARMHKSSLKFHSEAEGKREILLLSSSIKKAHAQQIIIEAAQQILETLPAHMSNGVMDLISYSELESELEAATEEIMNYKNKSGSSKTLEFELPELAFHQDSWEELPYEFLYFQVLELSGFTEHYSLIGHLKSSAWDMRGNAEVATSFGLEDLHGEPLRSKCVRAQGYLVDQERGIVHSRTTSRTFLSSIFDEKTSKEYGFTDEEGQRLCAKESHPLPIRLVIIARIMSTQA